MDDPVAHLPWRCDQLTRIGVILLVVLDDERRPLLLRNTARRLDVPYLCCEKHRGAIQFRRWLAEQLSLPFFRDTHDLWVTLRDRLRTGPRLVILDFADRLINSALETVISLHKTTERFDRQTSFVLASSTQTLLLNVERVSEFVGHVAYYIPGCEPTKKMREARAAFERATEPPTISFPSTTSAEASTDEN